MHLRYEIDYSEKRHAIEVIRDLGITYQMATPQSMAGQWFFWNCENVPQPLPAHFIELNLDPMECIGYGLSEDDAKKIIDCAQSKSD